jgi:hypothetical protein
VKRPQRQYTSVVGVRGIANPQLHKTKAGGEALASSRSVRGFWEWS